MEREYRPSQSNVTGLQRYIYPLRLTSLTFCVPARPDLKARSILARTFITFAAISPLRSVKILNFPCQTFAILEFLQ